MRDRALIRKFHPEMQILPLRYAQRQDDSAMRGGEAGGLPPIRTFQPEMQILPLRCAQRQDDSAMWGSKRADDRPLVHDAGGIPHGVKPGHVLERFRPD